MIMSKGRRSFHPRYSRLLRRGESWWNKAIFKRNPDPRLSAMFAFTRDFFKLQIWVPLPVQRLYIARSLESLSRTLV